MRKQAVLPIVALMLLCSCSGRNPEMTNSYNIIPAPAGLVMLKGEYRIIPPDPEHTYTPEPLAEGCISVIVDQDGRSELMAAACAE